MKDIDTDAVQGMAVFNNTSAKLGLEDENSHGGGNGNGNDKAWVLLPASKDANRGQSGQVDDELPADNDHGQGSEAKTSTSSENDIDDGHYLSKYPTTVSPTGFGEFGGQYAPELQMDYLQVLEKTFRETITEKTFWEEYSKIAADFRCPSALQLAENLTQKTGGANIWLKREDRTKFGSHKVHNLIGQILLAKRMGKKEIITDCGAARHGVVCAAICRKLGGLKCVVFMGARDAERQPMRVKMIKYLGGQVKTVDEGAGTLRVAVNEAMRASLFNFSVAYYVLSIPIGPRPLPDIYRTFQSVLGRDTKTQFQEMNPNKQVPDAIVTAVGGGSGAVGMFHAFIETKAKTKLIGVQAEKAAPLVHGSYGVFLGARTYLLQNKHGQILDAHAISPDLSYPMAGPELAYWKKSGAVEFTTVSDEQMLRGYMTLLKEEKLLVGYDSAHAVMKAIQLAKELGPGKDVIVLVSRSDEVKIHDETWKSAFLEG